MNAIIARPAVGATKAETRPTKGAKNPKSQPPLRCAAPADAEGASPTLIELFIRPKYGKKFGAPFSHMSDVIGLENPRIDATRWRMASCVCDHDTGYEIAEFKPNQGYQFSDLTEVRVTIDPATCHAEWSAAGRFEAAVLTFAEGMAGVVYDGLGGELSKEALADLTGHINNAILKRMRMEEAARTVQVSDDTKRIAGALPFQHMLVTKQADGRWRGYKRVAFDAPSLPYYGGRAEGLKMARAMVEYLKAHKHSDACLEETLREAFALMADQRGGEDADHKRNAAAGYIRCMTTLIKVGASNLNMKWLEQQISQYEDYERSDRPRREARKAAFVNRMKTAREAKQKGGKV